MAQVYHHGNRHLLIDEIEDHITTKEAIQSDQGTYKTKYGFDRKKRATKGWKFYVKQKDGSGEWAEMKYLKDSYPISISDCTMSNRLQYEPVFPWWVTYTLKKRISISKIKSKYWKKPISMECKYRRT